MTFFKSIKTVFRKSFTFKGRASRSEYRNFISFMIAISLITFALCYYLDNEIIVSFYLLFDLPALLLSAGLNETKTNFSFLLFILNLYFWITFISLQIRRLHDIGKTGRWVIFALLFTPYSLFTIFFFPFNIGIYALLIISNQEGYPFDNKYGKVPE